MNDQQPLSKYERAKERVEEVKKFYKSLVSYVTISAFLVGINLLTTDFHWFWFPILGMGIGIVTQYVKIFGIPFTGIMGREWEEKKIMEEMYRLDQEEEQVKWLKERKKYKEELDLNEEPPLDINLEKLRSEDDKQHKID